MSENDRFDWSDDEDFESLAGEPIEGFADLEDEFDADYAEDVSSPAPEASQATEHSDQADKSTDNPAKAPSVAVSGRNQGLSGRWLGFFYSISVWTAAAGIGTACLLALGLSPNGLWQPDKLTLWSNYLDPMQHPVNMLALVVFAVVIFTVVMSSVFAKAVNNARRREQDAADMLSKVTALRLENENAWQESQFSSHAPAATFVSETLGAWRLQAARQRFHHWFVE